MKCHKCKEVGVENEVLGKKFWYCRDCKIEIDETPEDYPYGFNKNHSNMNWADTADSTPYMLHIDDDGNIKPYPSVSMNLGDFLKNT